MTIIKSAAFLKRNLGAIKKFGYGRRKRENFLMWLAWHFSRYNACSVEKDGKIIAVGVARTIKEKNDSRFPYKNDEAGKICYVEQVACKTNEGFKSLLSYVKKRWAHCDKIMFHRSKSGSILRTYEMKEFMRKAGV